MLTKALTYSSSLGTTPSCQTKLVANAARKPGILMLPTVAEHARNVLSVVRARNPHAVARPYIADSWIRCSSVYELDPAASRAPATVTQVELASRRERLEDLVQVARIEMVNLYQQLAGSGYALVLTDRDGVVLDLFGDPSFVQTASAGGLMAGAIWSERFQGTNGMGTCIVERTPIVVHHTEHFFARNIGLTCSASPIFNHEGELVAVLDASGHSRLAQQHTLALVNMSAQMIENRTFIRRLQDRHLLRFHSRPEFVGTLNEGVIAFDPTGKLIAANRHAIFQLGLNGASELLGRSFSELFGVSLTSICETSTRKSFHPTPVFDGRTGSRFFAVAQRPAGQFGRSALVAVGTQHQRRGATAQNRSPLDALDTGDARLSRLIAHGRRAVCRGVAVLVQGESGTGKSVLARALHAASPRADKPLADIDCANLSSHQALLETLSCAPSSASLERYQGGTVLLDEVADLSHEQQGRLLRLFDEIERDTATPRGDLPALADGPVPRIDLRLICTSRLNLADEVAAGRLREDFYYRIAGLTLDLPPLRERTDLRALIERLLRELLGPDETVDIDEQLLQVLTRYSWPGNIRQLRSVLRSMLLLRDDDRLTATDAPADLAGAEQNAAGSRTSQGSDSVPHGPALVDLGGMNPLDAAERQALLRELDANHWGISRVARSLGMSRNTLYRKMERLKLRESARQGPAPG